MIAWAWRWIVWLLIRVAITGAIIFTMQMLLHLNGYWIPTNNLIMCTLLIIIGIRCWSGSPENTQ
jgi:hypothetical protein